MSDEYQAALEQLHKTVNRWWHNKSANEKNVIRDLKLANEAKRKMEDNKNANTSNANEKK